MPEFFIAERQRWDAIDHDTIIDIADYAVIRCETRAQASGDYSRRRGEGGSDG